MGAEASAWRSGQSVFDAMGCVAEPASLAFAPGSPCHWAVTGDGLSCLSLGGTQAVAALGQDLWKGPLARRECPDLFFPP